MAAGPAPPPTAVLREKDFFNKKAKTCRSRVEETHLHLQLESLQVRLDLLRREEVEKRALVEARKCDAASVSDSNVKRTQILEERRRVVCVDRQSFAEWSDDFRTTSKECNIRMAALNDIRFVSTPLTNTLNPAPFHLN